MMKRAPSKRRGSNYALHNLLIRFLLVSSCLLATNSRTGTFVSAFVLVQHQHKYHHHVQQQHQLLTKLPTKQCQKQPQQLSTASTKTTQLNAVMDVIGVSPEPIHTAFTIATFLPQPFWLLIILLPNWEITKKIMGGLEIVLLCSLIHFSIVVTSIVQPNGTGPLAEFNNVFDPSGDPQLAFMNMVTNYPNFVAEEWSHVLTWDLFVGRWIWLDGIERGIFTGHSVLLTNLIGPPGLLLHAITCLVTGKGLVPNQALEIDSAAKTIEGEDD